MLLTGGIHGDEYEGQIALSRLARTLDPAQVQGRVIIIPAYNLPAALNDTRLSPVDNRDMNRCFPGNPKGTFSEMLAHFLDGYVLPHADVSVDLHTAGHSMESALSTNMHYVSDAEIRRKTMATAAAFGAPFNTVFWGVNEGATFTSCVERRGIISIGTELGGWGRVNVEGVRIGRRGVDNVLKHFGVIEGKPDTTQRDGTAGTRHMMVRDSEPLQLRSGGRPAGADRHGWRRGEGWPDSRLAALHRGHRSRPDRDQVPRRRPDLDGGWPRPRGARRRRRRADAGLRRNPSSRLIPTCASSLPSAPRKSRRSTRWSRNMPTSRSSTATCWPASAA